MSHHRKRSKAQDSALVFLAHPPQVTLLLKALRPATLPQVVTARSR
jgi:hypothetical protein